MTKDECINRFKHTLWGVMLDVCRTGTTGSHRAALEDKAMAKIDAVIGAIWEEFHKKVETPKEQVKSPNGQPAQPKTQVWK